MLLVLVIALTAALRYVGFESFPPGLWYDEAYSLAEGQRLAQGGDLRIYYPEKHGEPAIIWLTALALRLGAGHLAPRWVSSVSSIVSVCLLFFAVRDVLQHESSHADWLALGAAAALGINYEFLFHSRMSWQGALATTPFLAAVWLFWRGLRKGRCRDFGAAGLMAGLSQYTGVAARLLPLVFLLMLPGWLGEGRAWWRARLGGLLVTAGAALLAYSPLAHAFLANPEWFGRRLQTADVSSSLLSNIGRTLAGWLFLGEAALHSLPGRPIYDPVMGFLVLAGAATVIARIRRPAYSVWLAWFFGVQPGGFLSSPTPVFYRVMTAVPATAALSAVGGWHLWCLVSARLPRLRHLASVLLLVAFAGSLWATCRDYFVRWASWPQLPQVMDVWKWRAAEVIVGAPVDERLFVTMPDGLEPAITYALHARTASHARSFDGANCLVVPAEAGGRAHYVIVLGYEHRTVGRLRQLYSSGYQTFDPKLGRDAPYFVNFFVPPDARAAVPGALSSPLEYGDVLLHGVHLSAPTISAPDTLTATLTWEILEPSSNDYTAFVHLLDGRPEAADAPLRGQHDSPPCNSTEPTWKWRPGEYVLDEHVLNPPADLPLGEYLLGIGLYDSLTKRRVPPAGKDLQIRWDEAIVGSVTVVAP
jgi:hypothetical protein